MGQKLETLRGAAKALAGANMMNAKQLAADFAVAALAHAEHAESALRAERENSAKLAAEVKRLRDVVAELCSRNGMAGALQ